MGWAIFAVATLTYLLTIGPSASLWDCAEFIACDYKLEIGHPPGAPFYMLVYNVISHLGGSPERAALMTNATSAVLSGLTDPLPLLDHHPHGTPCADASRASRQAGL